MTDDFATVRETAALLERDSQRARRVGVALVSFVTLAALFLVATVGYLAFESRRERRDRAKADAFAGQVILCVLDELGELRKSAEEHYTSDGRQARPPAKPTLEEQAGPEATERLERACQPVLDQLRDGD